MAHFTFQNKFFMYRNRDFPKFRDKLIHNYFGIDLLIVWETIQDELLILEENVITLRNSINKVP